MDLAGHGMEAGVARVRGFLSRTTRGFAEYLKTHQTDSMMVISRGHVVFEYGDSKLVSKVASVRKSMLSLLYAVEMQKGLKFDLHQTVEQLGLEDKTPFIESERHATLQQLMMARSGIYIRSGNDQQDKLSPKRGSSYPGVRWFYNNWDFDAAGLAFEKIAHQDIFDALRDDLALPLRFQDYDRSRPGGGTQLFVAVWPASPKLGWLVGVTRHYAHLLS
jgi:CubicO group peptidase (beta-lactamase class C family)